MRKNFISQFQLLIENAKFLKIFCLLKQRIYNLSKNYMISWSLISELLLDSINLFFSNLDFSNDFKMLIFRNILIIVNSLFENVIQKDKW